MELPAGTVGVLLGTLTRKTIPNDANELGIGNFVTNTNTSTKNLPDDIAYGEQGEGTLIQFSGGTQDYFKSQTFHNQKGIRHRYYRSSWSNWE